MALVEYEVRDKLACITLNRPEKVNAINHEMSERIFSLFAEMERDPGVWGCLITGEGKAFSSGHDLTEPPPEDREVKPAIRTLVEEEFRSGARFSDSPFR